MDKPNDTDSSGVWIGDTYIYPTMGGYVDWGEWRAIRLDCPTYEGRGSTPIMALLDLAGYTLLKGLGKRG